MVYGLSMTIPCRIEISPTHRIEIIGLIRGLLTIQKEFLLTNNEILGHAKIEIEGYKDIDIPSRIEVTSNKYSIDFSGSVSLEDNMQYKDIQCHFYLSPTGSITNEINGILTLENTPFIYDLQSKLYYERFKTVYDPLIVGIVRYRKDKLENSKDNEIIGSLTLLGEIRDNYHTDLSTNANEIYATLTYSPTDISSDNEFNPIIDQDLNIRANEIFGSVNLRNMTLEEYKYEIDPYFMHSTQHNEIIGKAIIENNQIYHTLLDGTARIEIDSFNKEIEGRINYERDTRIIDLYGKVILEKSGDITTDIQGIARIELQSLHNTTPVEFQGKVHIPSFYKAIYIPCRLKIRKRDFVHSIFCRVIVPPQRKIYIPCRIVVETPNKLSQNILLGSITLDQYDTYSQDILQSTLAYLPGVCIDIVGKAYIDAIYTRREIDSRIEVVLPSSYTIPCTIKVVDDKPILIDRPEITRLPNIEYYPIPKTLDPILEYNPKRVHIIVDNNTTIPSSSLAINHLNKLESKIKKHTTIPKGKIVIAVSPTWNYDPYVFKGSLVTFLDRYYQKSDIAIVFGGNPRADFDIINLSLNYKIKRENLCGVMIDKDEHRQFHVPNFANKFINTMINFKKEEYPDILRVFMFINQPNWYYNDPLSSLATYCKTNNISAVAISPGGEYCEILEEDKIIDDLKNAREWTRQHPYHRTDYVNIKLPDTDRIVY